MKLVLLENVSTSSEATLASSLIVNGLGDCFAPTLYFLPLQPQIRKEKYNAIKQTTSIQVGRLIKQ